MAKNRYIDTHFWDDNYITELDPSEKLLFIYFLTNPLTNISGLYEIPLKKVAYDSGIDINMVMQILARFDRDGKMKYDDGWLVITNFIKHQKLNPNVKKGIHDNLEKAPKALKKWLFEQSSERLSKAFKGFELLKPKPKPKLKLKLKLKHEPKPKHNEAKASDDFVSLLPKSSSQDLRQAWLEWVQHRKEIKKNLTASTAKKQIKQLEKWGEPGAIASIEQSITNGWTGLFEPKGEKVKKDEHALIMAEVKNDKSDREHSDKYYDARKKLKKEGKI